VTGSISKILKNSNLNYLTLSKSKKLSKVLKNFSLSKKIDLFLIGKMILNLDTKKIFYGKYLKLKSFLNYFVQIKFHLKIKNKIKKSIIIKKNKTRIKIKI
jgi:hypothetical protein